MARVKRGPLKTKKRRKLLKQTKGFKWGRKNKKRQAKEALLHAMKHAFVGRKQKKRDYRRLWQVKINAKVRQKGLKYSEFIHLLKENNINLNRKILADLAQNQPEVFDKIIETIAK